MSSNYLKEIRKVSELRNNFYEAMKDASFDSYLNGPDFRNRHLCYLNLCFPSTNAKAVLDTLQPNLCASFGAACSSGIDGPSETLLATGLELEDANASLRFSFGLTNTEEQLRSAIELVSSAISGNR